MPMERRVLGVRTPHTSERVWPCARSVIAPAPAISHGRRSKLAAWRLILRGQDRRDGKPRLFSFGHCTLGQVDRNGVPAAL